MNEYMDGVNRGVFRADKLKQALQAWRRLEKEQNWNDLR
jgi:hypothetical protein